MMGANHIVMAKPPQGSRVATRSAKEQIDIILAVFDQYYNIQKRDLICLHFIGGGKKLEGSIYKINEENILHTREILRSMKSRIIFDDSGSYTVSKYSISDRNLSVFVENKFINEHLSFSVNLDRLFKLDPIIIPRLPISSLKRSREFDYLVDEGVIFSVTGSKLR